MTTADEVTCAHPGCSASHKDHLWGQIKADDWFHQKDGTAWCPDHHPEWVASWRARQRAEAAALEVTAAPCPRCFTVPAKNGACGCE